MKKFLVNFIALSLIVLAVTAVIECLLLTRPNRYSYKSDYVKTHADEIECLLLGNSHIEEGLNPDSMGTGVFNMAISGRYLPYDVELARMHVPRLHHLQVLVVPYDYYAFYLGRNEGTDEKNRIREELTPTIKCMNYKYMGIRTDGWWWWSEFLNSNEDFMSRFFKSDKELTGCDSLGYMALKPSNKKENWKQKGLPDRINLAKVKDEKQFKALEEEFESFAEITQAAHVRLVLLSTPMYETYRGMMSAEIMDEMSAFVKALQEKYPHVEYYDYTSDSRFVDDDFHDASHLSEAGAAKFSKIVKTEILEK